MKDKILISDLVARVVIGVGASEREARQQVIINVILEADTRAAAASDDLSDTVDYGALCRRILRLAEDSNFSLVETLASEIARLCLAQDLVEAVTVRVEKPRALRYARSAGVEITRRRGEVF